MGRNDEGALQLLESVMVALFIFIAIAIVAIHRIPTSPSTFQASELASIASDALKVRQARTPASNADCNESAPPNTCPFSNELERVLSLALGYRGPHNDTVCGTPPSPLPAVPPLCASDTEKPDPGELQEFLDQALPAGARYILTYGNGHNDTVVYPTNLRPPASTVVVARTLLDANWTSYANTTYNSSVVRIGERGDMTGAFWINDPLGRWWDEAGHRWRSVFGASIPSYAPLGTYQVCYQGAANPCPRTGGGTTLRLAYNVTVVPADLGVRGAGSRVLASDPDAGLTGTALKDWGSGHLQDIAGSSGVLVKSTGVTGPKNTFYLHQGGGATIAVGDVRLTYVAACRDAGQSAKVGCPAGSWVRSTDADLTPAATTVASYAPVGAATKMHLANAPGGGACATPLASSCQYYLRSASGASAVALTDLRLSRWGPVQEGTRVMTGELDVGLATVEENLTQFKVQYDDVNGDGSPQEGEPVYLNCIDAGLGMTSAVDVNDVQLSMKGQAPTRSFYDVKLEAWYGV